ncbi:MAG: HlyD family efflux transporter periplasmic adaptor subunit [Planctomycetes bacterium]|nr:HlyD family efflux transporter periplasmic adaptor subunit [Planctomycetota bacterium]
MESPRLPPLRGDIEILPAGESSDGSPMYTVHDPVASRYVRVGWGEAAALAEWEEGLSLDEFAGRLRERTTLRASGEEIRRLVAQVGELGLAAPSRARTGAHLEAEAARKRIGWFLWLVHHYLYIRIPLLRPDAFLRRTLFLARPLASKPALACYAFATLLGLWFLAGRWESYLATFPRFLSGSGLLAYGAALVFVKVLHEFGHGYAARSQGVRVRSMGIALLVFWPVPYCDVTDAWRLPGRWQRATIGLAGVAVELVLAGLALLAWALSPPGLAKSLFFLVSSGTLVSTLVANLNPAMRFDGYYVLSDLWGIENLQARAFAQTRWALRRLFLGLREPAPEAVSLGRLEALAAYSIYSWVYRVGLYAAIALLVYHFFVKVVGILLFAVEIWFFLLRPAWTELRELLRLRGRWFGSIPSIVTGLGVLSLLAWIALPLPRTVELPAVVVPAASETLYAPVDGYLTDLAIGRGTAVRAGDVLFRIESPGIDREIEILRYESKIQEARRRAAEADPELAAGLPGLLEEIAKNEAALRALTERKTQATVRARIDGIVDSWDAALREGQAVRQGTYLGRLADPARCRLVAYLRETDLGSLAAGDSASFYPSRGGPAVQGRVTALALTPAAGIEHRSLTSVEQGDLPVREAPDGTLQPIDVLYELELAPDGPVEPGMTGILRTESPARSLLGGWLEGAWRVLLREGTF